MSNPYHSPGAGPQPRPEPVSTRPVSTVPGTTVPGRQARHPGQQPPAGDQQQRQGRALAGFAALIQFGLLVAIGVSIWQFSPELFRSTADSIQTCEAAGGDLSCVTSAEVWRYALWPLAGVIAAFSLFRGAMAGNARRPGGGMVLTLLGYVILAATMANGLI